MPEVERTLKRARLLATRVGKPILCQRN